MILLDDENWGNTTISRNTYLIRNSTLEVRDLIISSLHIGIHTDDKKYRFKSSKIEAVTNINIHKITERIESYTILEVTDDEGSIDLLINIKYTVIAAEPYSPLRNTPHLTKLYIL